MKNFGIKFGVLANYSYLCCEFLNETDYGNGNQSNTDIVR